MSENTTITQKAGLGASDNTFIGEQNNYGLSVIDATTMAFTMFRQYYPQLRDEALSELKRMVNEKLSEIPSNQITPPSARIAVPALMNASITEEADIRELYANLLVNSMDSVVKNGVHPGFVEVIKQLSPDEAKILKYIMDSNYILVPTITIRFENSNGDGIETEKNFSVIGELLHCERPFDISMYFDNLIRLGLLKASNHSHIADKSKYEPLKQSKYILEKLNNSSFSKTQYNNPKLIEGYIEITDYGKAFCSKCLKG